MTAKQIRVGILTEDPSSTKTAAQFGVKGLDVGDLPANWQALVADQNRHGGLFGRQIVPVLYEISLTSSDPSGDEQKACTKFTQDTPVYAVFSDVIFDDNFGTCVKKANVPLFYGEAAADIGTLRSLGNVIVTASPSLERFARDYVDALASTGFLQAKNKIGVIQTDLPRYDKVMSGTFRPEVKRLGLNLTAVAVVPPVASGDYGGLTSALAAAVLRFKSAGVDRVMFIATNATEPLLWQDSAASQNYSPPEGLSSVNAPELLQTSGSKKELADAQGMGWIPAADVTNGHDGGMTATQQHCAAVLKAGGQTTTSRSALLEMEMECDMFFLFAQASKTLPVPVNGAGYVAAVEKLGTAYRSVATFAADFRGRPDGPGAYKPFAYQQGCTCFSYTGGSRPLR